MVMQQLNINTRDFWELMIRLYITQAINKYARDHYGLGTWKTKSLFETGVDLNDSTPLTGDQSIAAIYHGKGTDCYGRFAESGDDSGNLNVSARIQDAKLQNQFLYPLIIF